MTSSLSLLLTTEHRPPQEARPPPGQARPPTSPACDNWSGLNSFRGRGLVRFYRSHMEDTCALSKVLVSYCAVVPLCWCPFVLVSYFALSPLSKVRSRAGSPLYKRPSLCLLNFNEYLAYTTVFTVAIACSSHSSTSLPGLLFTQTHNWAQSCPAHWQCYHATS